MQSDRLAGGDITALSGPRLISSGQHIVNKGRARTSHQGDVLSRNTMKRIWRSESLRSWPHPLSVREHVDALRDEELLVEFALRRLGITPANAALPIELAY